MEGDFSMLIAACGKVRVGSRRFCTFVISRLVRNLEVDS